MTRTHTLYAPLAALMLVGCTSATEPGQTQPRVAPEPVDPDQFGPYAVGVDTLEFTDTRGKALTVEVWFPADVEAGAEPDPYLEIPITLRGHRDVPADRRGAPYPVIGFSHGLGGIRFQSASLCEYLASHGFVVVSPDHEGHLLYDFVRGFDSSRTGQVILERPGDVSESVDYVLGLTPEESPHLAGLADASRMGLVGHSFGAINALMIAGADDDLPGLTTWCEENGGNACNYVDRIDFDATEQTDFADERVVATVALSPGGWYAFGHEGEGLARMPPTLVMGGTRDDTLSWETEISPTFDALSPPRYLAELADAGHNAAFSDLCLLLVSHGDCVGADRGYLPAADGHAIVYPLTTAFLRKYVRDESAMDGWLSAPFTDGLGALTWTAEP